MGSTLTFRLIGMLGGTAQKPVKRDPGEKVS